MAQGRAGSRIRAVAPAFPSQGPAFLVGTLAGTTIRMIRETNEPRIRSKLHRQLVDVPQREMVLTAPYNVPRDAGGHPALAPGGDYIPATTPPVGTTPPGSAGNCGCG